MKKNLIFSLFFSLILVVAAIFFSSKKTDAQTAGGFNLIGGKITAVEYCCNGLVLTVTGVDGGDFFMSWADIANPTVDYSDYQVFYGGQQPTVGKALPVGLCSTISSECESMKSVQGGTVYKIGTGLPGGK
jgi:hypothetical protein